MTACPFCAEEGFDLPGLKLHLQMGWCAPYDATRIKIVRPPKHTLQHTLQTGEPDSHGG